MRQFERLEFRQHFNRLAMANERAHERYIKAVN